MLGLLVSELEINEMEYLVKRELEELLMDFEDERIENIVKEAMQKRYKVLFNLFRKIASEEECSKYILIPRDYN